MDQVLNLIVPGIVVAGVFLVGVVIGRRMVVTTMKVAKTTKVIIMWCRNATSGRLHSRSP